MPASGRSAARSFAWIWGPVLLYTVLVFAASSFPQPSESSLFTFQDKVEHLVEYGIFGLLLGRATLATARPGTRRNAAGLAVLTGLVVAVADEAYQSATPGRSSSLGDLAVDGAALVLGATLIAWGWRRRARARHAVE